MKVYEAVANAFVKEGTDIVFGLLGSQIDWWGAMAKHPGMRMVDAREEGAALAMADGWARTTGRIGVCSVHYGAGIARTTTTLICATRAHTPLVVCTSETALNNERHHQYLDTKQLVKSTGAGYTEILTPSYAEAGVRQAFYRARLESRPQVLCLPVNIEDMEIDSEGDDYETSASLFTGQQRIRPDLQRLNDSVGIIAASKKPVVVLGRGAMTPEAKEAAKRLAERIGALTATSLIAKGALSSEYHVGISGLYSTRAAMKLFEDADCMIALGAGLNERTLAGGYLYPKAKIIHIDIAPHLVMGNEKSADCYVQGDAAETTREIDELLEKKGYSNEGYRTAAVRKALQGADRDPGEFEIEPGTLDSREVVRLMDQQLPEKIALVDGIGHSASFPRLLMKPRALQIFVTGFSSIGQVLASSIGVSIGTDMPVVAVEGDGGAMQNIQELDTLGRLGVKLLYIIMNDEAYGAEYQRVVVKGLPPNLSMVRSPDFVSVAQGFRCRARIARTLDEVGAALKEFMAGDGPMVLDVRVSRNVIAIPYRRLLYGEDV